MSLYDDDYTGEEHMSDSVKKPYAFVIGQVQAFTKDGVKQPACKVGDANGQAVYNFTIKTALGNLVDIALWSEYAHVAPSIQESYIMFVDGPVSQREYQGKVYTKIDAKRLSVIPAVVAQEREIVNQVAAAPVVAPVAAPVAAAVDPVALAQAQLAAAQAAAAAATAPVAAPVAAAEGAAPFSF